MSTDWVSDIERMHHHYGVREAVNKMDNFKLRKFLEFRINFLQEELNELRDAKSAEDVVDALIDLCVVAIGTLDAYNVNAHQAWDEVFAANMNKQVGIKEGRPNELGLPDLIKPVGWQAPSHKFNHGSIAFVFE